LRSDWENRTPAETPDPEARNVPAPFQPLPDAEPLILAWPTPSRSLRGDPDRYFAFTAANPRYGRPGWTRDCGRRFHRGCDIAPVRITRTGRRVTVRFSDLRTGREYPSREEVLVPHDPVFAVSAGAVEEACADEAASDYGLHVVLRHAWPGGRADFFTLYAHLAEVQVARGQTVEAGTRLGTMGTTSRIADARTWMAIAPHLHFEAWDARGRPYDPTAFLAAFLPR
jgi:murein DD-endopeptidase MepM/ murein hydrolase activator NlpD